MRKQHLARIILGLFYVTSMCGGVWGISSCLATDEGGKIKEEPQQPPLEAVIHLAPRLEAYLKARNAKLNDLASKYGKVIDTHLNKATAEGDLRKADAFQKEKSGIESLKKALAGSPEDPVAAARESVSLPGLVPGSPEALVSLRKIWDGERDKIQGALDSMLQQSLRSLESGLTKNRNDDIAQAVLAYRESLVSGASDAGSSKGAPGARPGSGGGMENLASVIPSATKDKPFENTLGMPFVPVNITGGPTNGKTILFCIWETRVKDYEAFIRVDRGREWRQPNFKQRNDHPAVNVSWDDAVAFCEWLTKKERGLGKLGNNEEYRLPSDHEWSCAVGIGDKEDAGMPPATKFSKIVDVYPWGEGFPPKRGGGNYFGEETRKAPRPGVEPIKDYDDGFERTAPVGSFDPNPLGIYDLGGNVWEWCQDWFDPQRQRGRVYRGASWMFSDEKVIRSSGRGNNIPGDGLDVTGFRLVISNNNS